MNLYKFGGIELVDLSKFRVIRIMQDETYFFIQGQYENGDLYNLDNFEIMEQAQRALDNIYYHCS